MLYAIVNRGSNAGIRLTPHLYKDSRFRVAKRKEGPYIAVDTEEAIPSYLREGYRLRMSNPKQGHSPSLIRPKSIRGWR